MMKTPEFWTCLIIGVVAAVAGDDMTARLFFAATLIIGACAK